MLALIPRSFVRWIGTKDEAAGQRIRDLLGVTMPLSESRAWTEQDCATWQRLDSRRMSIIARIASGDRTLQYQHRQGRRA